MDKLKLTSASLLLAFLFLGGCASQKTEKRSDSSPPSAPSLPSLEQAIKKPVNNPVDNAVKLNQTKKALEKQVKEYQSGYKTQLQEATQE